MGLIDNIREFFGSSYQGYGTYIVATENSIQTNPLENSINDLNKQYKLGYSTAGNYVKFGVNDDFPNVLERMLRQSPVHAGIITKKAKMVSGNGIEYNVDALWGIVKANSKCPRDIDLIDNKVNLIKHQEYNLLINSPDNTEYFTEIYHHIQMGVLKDDKILEIGTGSGYQTAVLCAMGATVYSIERQNKLFKKTSLLLPKLGFNPKKLIFGDGYKGLPEAAPFDSIIVTAGAPFIPKPLMAQLKIGGKLVIPLGEENQIMTMLIRKNETQFEKHEFGEFRFVPLLGDKN